MSKKKTDRYKKTHEWGNSTFTLTHFYPYEDECKLLLSKMLEQAIRDYISLANASSANDQMYYQTATGLIFDNDYYIDYGGYSISLQDLLDYLDIDIDIEYFREKIEEKSEKRRKKKGK